MRLIHRYIFSEIFPVFIIGNVFLTFMLLLEKIVKLSDLFFAKDVEGFLILQTLVYYLPSFFMLTIPVSALLASLIGFGRLSGDSEIVAMQASGANWKTFSISAVILGGVSMGIALIMSIWLMPIGSERAIDNLFKMAATVSVKDMKEKEIYDEIPNMVFYASEKQSDTSFKKIVIIDRANNNIISAQKGNVLPSGNGGLLMKLNDGRMITTAQDGRHSIVDFTNFNINQPIEAQSRISSKPVRYMTLPQLKNNFNVETIYKYEFSKRFAMPAAALIMCFLGMGLGIFSKRAGRTLGVPISLVILATYNMMVFSFENMSISGQLEAFTAAWLPNAVIFAMTAVVWKRVFR